MNLYLSDVIFVMSMAISCDIALNFVRMLIPLLQHLLLEDKGKAPMMVELRGQDKEGFLPSKTKAKGHGQKRPLKDRQIDGSFNRFQVLENLALEEGVPHVVTSNSVWVSMEVVLALELDPTQVIQEQQVDQVPLNNSIDDDIVLADLARGVLVSSQNKISSHRLGVQ